MRIYLDHNATTPVAPAVAEAMMGALRETFGNPSSVHYFGQQAKAALDEARAAVAALIGGEPSEVVFTGGGTEADNLAVRGIAEVAEPLGRRHLVVSAIEHEAVLNTAKALARRGWRVTHLAPDSSGYVAPEQLEHALVGDTALVSVMHANNEVGTLQPVAALAAIAHAHGVPFHTDAVQSVGKISVDRLGARRGSAVARRAQVPRAERRRRPVDQARHAARGHPDRRTPGAQSPRGHGERARHRGARRGSPPRAREARDGGGAARDPSRRAGARRPGSRARVAINGGPGPRVPNTTNVSFDGVEAESLLIALDLEGIAVSTGSACSSGTLEPSHVLRAMGLSAHRTQSSLRFSLARAAPRRTSYGFSRCCRDSWSGSDVEEGTIASRFKVQSSGFRVLVQGSKGQFRVQGSGSGFEGPVPASRFGAPVQGSRFGFRVRKGRFRFKVRSAGSGFKVRVQGSKGQFRVQGYGSGFQGPVPASRFGAPVQGSRFGDTGRGTRWGRLAEAAVAESLTNRHQ